MAQVASSSSDSSNVLSFPDHLTGRRRRVSLALLQSSKQLRAPIMKPLEFMMAEARFLTLRSPRGKHRRQQSLPPLGSVVAECSPCGRVRVMFRCVAFACQRLATAPADMPMTSISYRWAEVVTERVTRGRVKKVQVRLQRRACCAVVCAALVVPVLACVVCLTRAAANACWF